MFSRIVELTWLLCRDCKWLNFFLLLILSFASSSIESALVCGGIFALFNSRDTARTQHRKKKTEPRNELDRLYFFIFKWDNLYFSIWTSKRKKNGLYESTRRSMETPTTTTSWKIHFANVIILLRVPYGRGERARGETQCLKVSDLWRAIWCLVVWKIVEFAWWRPHERASGEGNFHVFRYCLAWSGE